MVGHDQIGIERKDVRFETLELIGKSPAWNARFDDLDRCVASELGADIRFVMFDDAGHSTYTTHYYPVDQDKTIDLSKIDPPPDWLILDRN